MGWSPEYLATKGFDNLTRCYRVEFKSFLFRSIFRIITPDLDKRLVLLRAVQKRYKTVV
jgi:hypothetical protein